MLMCESLYSYTTVCDIMSDNAMAGRYEIFLCSSIDFVL